MSGPAPGQPALHLRDQPMLGVACKVVAAAFFAVMFASVRRTGAEVPIGEIVVFRSGFGMLVIVVAAFLTGGPALLMTKRIDSHALRSLAGTVSMFCNFAAYIFLPMADATAIGFAAPLFIVILAATMLGERVHIWRWSAVILGFTGVLIIAGPEASVSPAAVAGAGFALLGAATSALAMVFLRRMSAHEHSITIAFYFMATSAFISLFTIPLGWIVPNTEQTAILILGGLSGGVGQLFLSYSYRYAEASVLAPFDYIAMIWAVLLGYFWFAELPTAQVWIGAAIVIAAGLLILWRERQLGKKRALSPPTL